MSSQMRLLDGIFGSLPFLCLFFSIIIIIVYTFHSQEIIKYINNAVAINLNVLNISHCTFAVEKNEIKE